MSKKIFKTVASVAAIAVAIAAAIPSGGTSLLAVAAAGIGTSAAVLSAGALALSLGTSLLFKPKSPSVSPASTDRLTASIDPRTPRKFVFGTTAFATDIRDQEFSDGQEYLHRFIVLASHEVASIDQIWFDDKLAWSATGGYTSDFSGYFQHANRMVGTAADAVNLSSRMGATRRYTGLAYVYLRYKLTGNSKKSESPFAQSVPSRVTIIGNGAKTYDPRLDSTVAGGSGSMRAADQTTWAWDENSSRNPAIQLLWYLLGWRIQNPATGEWRLAVGKGIPAARIDLASFITAANLCDEPVTLAEGGTQPRYRSDGLFSEGDDTSTVLDQLKACMNAELDDVDGKIRITVLHNDLATPIADFSEDDIISGFTWDQTAPLNEMFNVVRGTFIDPSTNSLYQAVDYPEVRIPSPDGIDRIETVNFQTVQDARQAQRLVKQRVARMLYSGRFTATFGFRAWKVQKNDVIRLTFAPLGWTNKLFRVAETSVQVDGQVPMILQVEHEDIYLWDRDERPAIEPVEPTRYNPYLNPIYQDVSEPKYGDGTPIDDLKPAEPGATNGAPVGTPVGLSNAQDVVDALLALGSTTDPAEIVEGAINLITRDGKQSLAIYEAQILGEERKERWERLTHLDGVEITTSVREEITKRIDGDTAIIEMVNEYEVAATDGISAAMAAISDEASLRAAADVAETAERELAISLLHTTVDDAVLDLQAAILSEATTRADAIAAETAQRETAISVLQADVDGDIATVTAALASEETTRAAADEAEATAREALAASIDSELATVNAAILSEESARVTGDEAEATAREALAATLASDIADVSAAVESEAVARAAEDGALASLLSAVQTTVDGNTASVLLLLESVDGLEARAGVRLDVNGKVTGWIANNDGDEGRFDILADYFGVTSDDGAYSFADGRQTIMGGSVLTISGRPFGSDDQFIEWTGPIVSTLEECTEANAIKYVKTNGQAYFGGGLSSGILKNEGTSSTIDPAAFIIVGPFASNGGPVNVNMSATFMHSYNCNSGTGAISGSGGGTLTLEWSSDGSTWNLLTTLGANESERLVEVDGQPSIPDFVRWSMAAAGTYTWTPGALTGVYIRLRWSAFSEPSLLGTTIINTEKSQRTTVIAVEQP